MVPMRDGVPLGADVYLPEGNGPFPVLLTLTHPQAEPVDRYRYDPRNPVPTSGGHGCCTGDIAPTGPLDQRVTEQRPDVLVYTTPPLEHDTEVTGPMSVRLFFSTDVPDTDFIITLADVAPDGKAIQITEGQVRTRFRESLERPSMLVPNRDYEVTINLWGASNVFKKGHRIRVHLTSSNFPRFNRNLNSGKPLGDETENDIRIANQVIYHDSRRPSSIVLPVIP
jgi:putative CocE/NonD family hydrolase